MATVKKIFEWLFYLIENTLTADTTDKIARVKTKKTKTVDDIAARIVQERTEYRKETIVNIIAMANAAKLEFLSQGEMVNDGMVIFEPAITGNFYESAEFDESRNACVVNTRVSNDVHAMLRQVKAVYGGLTVENGGAVITGITDTVSGAADGTVTPGKTITVTGRKIRVIPGESETVESCITYANLDTQEVISQEDPPAINDPGKIVLQLPMLGTGTWSLTVKTLFTSAATLLKAPRYITSRINLVVK
ncbi:MAG: DUF4469 domain-containing protein [Bacteroidales bacterium]|jgi:hypothetical protein|nr:DUF4469 domain-containing protein [Bacteroidales bacterium]